jgi:hypothetical protein
VSDQFAAIVGKRVEEPHLLFTEPLSLSIALIMRRREGCGRLGPVAYVSVEEHLALARPRANSVA